METGNYELSAEIVLAAEILLGTEHSAQIVLLGHT